MRPFSNRKGALPPMEDSVRVAVAVEVVPGSSVSCSDSCSEAWWVGSSSGLASSRGVGESSAVGDDVGPPSGDGESSGVGVGDGLLVAWVSSTGVGSVT